MDAKGKLTPYAVKKRRKQGREARAFLSGVQHHIMEHCQHIPANNTFGYIPHWPVEEDRLASILVGELRVKIEQNEVYAQDATTVHLPYERWMSAELQKLFGGSVEESTVEVTQPNR